MLVKQLGHMIDSPLPDLSLVDTRWSLWRGGNRHCRRNYSRLGESRIGSDARIWADWALQSPSQFHWNYY